MRRSLILPLFAALILSLSGCGAEEQTSTFFAMDTVMELKLYGDEKVIADSQALIADMESRLSATDPESELGKLNASGSADISPDTQALLERSLELCRLTGGALDVTVYPVVRAWGFTTGEYDVPTTETLDSLLPLVDYTKLTVTDGSTSLPGGAMADLGAVAKGWACDRLADLWRGSRVKSGLMNLGGSVYALGSKPDGSPWRVGVRDPFSASYLATVEVEDKAVVTSGGYERYFERDGVVYHHIIDPGTGYPARSGLASVTVIGPEAAMCDGLSTAVFVMGEERAAELWREIGGFDLVLVTDEGEIAVTETLLGSFSAVDGDKDVRVISCSGPGPG